MRDSHQSASACIERTKKAKTKSIMPHNSNHNYEITPIDEDTESNSARITSYEQLQPVRLKHTLNLDENRYGSQNISIHDEEKKHKKNKLSFNYDDHKQSLTQRKEEPVRGRKEASMEHKKFSMPMINNSPENRLNVDAKPSK